MGGSNINRALVVAAAAVALLAAAACGGSSKANKTPGPSPTQIVVKASVIPAANSTPLSDDAKTAVAAKGAVEMVDFSDKDGRYTVKVPRGWLIETNANSMSATLAGDPASATVGIYCLPGKTIAQLQDFDARLMQAANIGTIPFSAAFQVQVASLPAQEIPWKGHVGTVPLDRIYVYFEGHGCAWRIEMTTWPGLTTDQLKPILDTMLSSFAFTK